MAQELLAPAQQRQHKLATTDNARSSYLHNQPFSRGKIFVASKSDLFEIGNDQSKDQSVDTLFEDIGNPLGAELAGGPTIIRLSILAGTLP